VSPPPAAFDPIVPGAVAQDSDRDLRRRRKADADKAVQQAIAARRRNAIEAGRWLEREEAARVWSRELGGLVSAWDSFLAVGGPRAISGFLAAGSDLKAVGLALRGAWHGERRKIAEHAGRRRAALEHRMKK
jgi:hypothetical protein